jgi:hypothetical protein
MRPCNRRRTGEVPANRNSGQAPNAAAEWSAGIGRSGPHRKSQDFCRAGVTGDGHMTLRAAVGGRLGGVAAGAYDTPVGVNRLEISLRLGAGLALLALVAVQEKVCPWLGPGLTGDFSVQCSAGAAADGPLPGRNPDFPCPEAPSERPPLTLQAALPETYAPRLRAPVGARDAGAGPARKSVGAWTVTSASGSDGWLAEPAVRSLRVWPDPLPSARLPRGAATARSSMIDRLTAISRTGPPRA